MATSAAPTGFSRLLRNSALFALGAAVGKLVGIVLLPVLTRSLVPAEFGRVDVLSTMQSAAASVLLLGMDLAVTRLYADLDDGRRSSLFTTWLTGAAVLTLPVALVLAAGGATLSSALFGTDSYATAIALTGAAIIGSVVQVIGLTALRNTNRAGAFAGVSGGSLVLNGVLVVALVPSHPTATAVLAAMAISMCAGAAASLTIARRSFAGRPDLELGRRLLRLGLPLAPAVAATWVAELCNRTILLKQAGADQVAFFSVATRFSSVAVLVVLGFQMAWQPAAFALGQGTAALQQIAVDGRRILTGVAVAVVGVAACAPELLTLISGSAYDEAIRPIGLSLVFALGYAAYQTASMPSALSRQMRDIGLAAVLAAASGVALNLWLADAHGATGTAAAVAIGQFLGTALIIFLARKRAPVPYAWARLTFVVGAATAASIAATWPEGGAPVGVRAALAVGFLVLLTVEGSLRDLTGALLHERSRRNTT